MSFYLLYSDFISFWLCHLIFFILIVLSFCLSPYLFLFLISPFLSLCQKALLFYFVSVKIKDKQHYSPSQFSSSSIWTQDIQHYSLGQFSSRGVLLARHSTLLSPQMMTVSLQHFLFCQQTLLLLFLFICFCLCLQKSCHS